MPIDIERIRTLVPHAGAMCLLEQVISCSAESIQCETSSHLNPANPLRRNGHLSGICGIEYAAQAMALHGALRSTGAAGTQMGSPQLERPRHGYLVSVRGIECQTRYLDTIATPLKVHANHVFGDASSMVYSFAVASGEKALVTGRAAVMLA